MAINPNSLLSLAWDPPSVPQYATCDAIVPGFIFGGDYILPIVDRYEVELFNPVLNEYVNQGYFYTNAADLKPSLVSLTVIAFEKEAPTLNSR